METIEWETPPRSGTGQTPRLGRTQAFVGELRTRPGEWARYPWVMRSHSSATLYRKTYPGTEWTGRRTDAGYWVMWARWVGDEPDND